MRVSRQRLIRPGLVVLRQTAGETTVYVDDRAAVDVERQLAHGPPAGRALGVFVAWQRAGLVAAAVAAAVAGGAVLVDTLEVVGQGVPRDETRTVLARAVDPQTSPAAQVSRPRVVGDVPTRGRHTDRVRPPAFPAPATDHPPTSSTPVEAPVEAPELPRGQLPDVAGVQVDRRGLTRQVAQVADRVGEVVARKVGAGKQTPAGLLRKVGDTLPHLSVTRR